MEAAQQVVLALTQARGGIFVRATTTF